MSISRKRSILYEQLCEHEKRYIALVLADHGGNRSRAARALDLSRRTLLYKMVKYGLRKQTIAALRALAASAVPPLRTCDAAGQMELLPNELA